MDPSCPQKASSLSAVCLQNTGVKRQHVDQGLKTNLSYPESSGKQMAYVKYLSGYPFEAPALVNKVAPEAPGISAVQTVLGVTYRSAQEQICKFSFSPA